MGASAFFVQNLTFIENDKLDRLPAGLPRRLTGAECFSCMTPEEYPDILSGCKVRQDKVYRPGELRVGINNTMGAFGIVTYAFEETTAEKRRFTGQGDLTGNGKNRALFLFYMSSQGLIYFEYAHQEHISELRKKSATLVKEVVWDETKAPVQTYVIACSVNELLPKKFMFANAVFRTIQLENTAILASFNETSNRFAQIKEQDVYKAGLSAKVIDVDEAGETRGTFYAYISCGAYKLNFMLPMIVCLSLIIVLGLLSALYSPWDIIRRVPYNSRTWFRHSQDASKPVDSFSMSIEEYEQVDLWEGHEQFVTDEMILEELREAGEYRISLHARGSTGPSFEDHAVERDTPHTSTSIWTA